MIATLNYTDTAGIAQNGGTGRQHCQQLRIPVGTARFPQYVGCTMIGGTQSPTTITTRGSDSDLRSHLFCQGHGGMGIGCARRSKNLPTLSFMSPSGNDNTEPRSHFLHHHPDVSYLGGEAAVQLFFPRPVTNHTILPMLAAISCSESSYSCASAASIWPRSERRGIPRKSLLT
jgi:hypothetical protein